MTGFKWEEIHMESFGETQLFHIARNDAAKFEYRVQALELMLKRGYASAKHVELSGLVKHIKHPIVPDPIQLDPVAEENGALKASVTTLTMSEEPVRKMDTKIAPANEATTPEPTDTEKELTPNE
jgi:hypothetical protein